ncbi:DUF4326 domain-containing protein [Stappia sp.]|uniref:DUF4326 domain-containing protein n=1 Tax=Stappia sp. TaxID=1870903 RepID=UPI003C7E5502
MMTDTRPRRIQLRRTKGWRKPPNTVVVSRPSVFGNPFTVAAAREVGFADPHKAAVDEFRAWLSGNPLTIVPVKNGKMRRQTILARLPELRGKNLACWCPLDSPCHADVLLEMANAEDG